VERTVFLSSRYSDFVYNPATKSKCNFQLNVPLSIPSEYAFLVSVISANVPYSFYVIPTATTVQYIIGGVTKTLTVQPGNWTADYIAGTFLSDSSVTTTWAAATNTFTMTCGTSITLLASPLFGTLANTQGTNITSVVTPDIAGTRYVHVLSSLQTDGITTGTMPIGSGELAAIPVSAQVGNFITYMPNIAPKFKLRESTISNFDITLCDSNLNPLNMNGCDWEICLKVELYIPPGQEQTYSDAPKGLGLFDASRKNFGAK
jgi:hypothetical protein